MPTDNTRQAASQAKRNPGPHQFLYHSVLQYEYSIGDLGRRSILRDLESLFEAAPACVALMHSSRARRELGDLVSSVDRFSDATCLSLRNCRGETQLRINGSYHLLRCDAGGWLLLGRYGKRPDYWLPAAATLRRVGTQGHILEERDAELKAFDLDATQVEIALPSPPDGWVLDIVVWRLEDRELAAELQALAVVETQGYFLLGSHTRYDRPADLYRHLVHGWVYEDRYAWPHRRRICSENDAHALYLIFNGLERKSGKRIYRLLKAQLLLSVLSRQGQDGGFHHGEWTDRMEAHYRLNASAMHLFLDELQTTTDPTVVAAAVRLAEFLAANRDEMTVGAWFLHDALELSPAAMNQAPFAWRSSRVLGKSPSNMLVLNTHLDTCIALDRFGEVCRDSRYQLLVESACRSLRAVLALDAATWLYRPLFYAIGLTLLPAEDARKLPLPLRALKRATWKYLVPQLYRIKVRFPRLVMPNGFIDRNLALGTFAYHYLTVNLMDLVRFRRRFPQAGIDELIGRCARFIQTSGVRGRWKELSYERYALGFWAEALWHMCQEFPDHAEYPHWYVDACADLETLRMGLPPSHLGGNMEAEGPRVGH